MSWRSEVQKEWDDRHRTVVNSVYGWTIGTVIVCIAFWHVYPDMVEDQSFSLSEMTFVLTLVIIGLAAAIPHVFKQILSHWIRKIRNGGSK